MSKKIKRLMSLFLIVSTVLALFAMTSCGVTSAVEEFLTSYNYTFSVGKTTVKVDDSTVYCANGSVEEYLYYDDSAQKYYYAKAAGSIITKLYLDSEEYMFYHETLVSKVSDASKILSAFLQVSDKLEEKDDGSYSFNGCVLKEKDGVITCTAVGGITYTVSNVGETVITVPNNIRTMKASNEQGGKQ